MNNVELKKDERLDDLLFNDMKIIQNKTHYCFTSDAVLLANFAKAGKNDRVVDLCSGSGIVGILFYAKNLCKEVKLIELQKSFCDMANRSITLNNLQDKIQVINGKVQDAKKLLNNQTYDVVICNPPYKKVENHKITEKENIAMCKYELTLNFEELCKSVASILKFGGSFYFVHETDRLTEFITTLKKYELEPKVINFCIPQNKTESNVVLIKAVKNAKTGCKVNFINN